MDYKVLLEDNAIEDLDKAIAYHISFSLAKAQRLEKEVNKAITILERNPYFRIRYDNIRCLPLRTDLSYMLHYTIDEKTKTVFVLAIFNTLQNPNKYPK